MIPWFQARIVHEYTLRSYPNEGTLRVMVSGGYECLIAEYEVLCCSGMVQSVSGGIWKRLR